MLIGIDGLRWVTTVPFKFMNALRPLAVGSQNKTKGGVEAERVEAKATPKAKAVASGPEKVPKQTVQVPSTTPKPTNEMMEVESAVSTSVATDSNKPSSSTSVPESGRTTTQVVREGIHTEDAAERLKRGNAVTAVMPSGVSLDEHLLYRQIRTRLGRVPRSVRGIHEAIKANRGPVDITVLCENRFDPARRLGRRYIFINTPALLSTWDFEKVLEPYGKVIKANPCTRSGFTTDNRWEVTVVLQDGLNDLPDKVTMCNKVVTTRPVDGCSKCRQQGHVVKNCPAKEVRDLTQKMNAVSTKDDTVKVSPGKRKRPVPLNDAGEAPSQLTLGEVAIRDGVSKNTLSNQRRAERRKTLKFHKKLRSGEDTEMIEGKPANQSDVEEVGEPTEPMELSQEPEGNVAECHLGDAEWAEALVPHPGWRGFKLAAPG
ncbi:hypothetical protein BD770DRAFT_449406 [Pilaira anomala]|nr:hypothetical protein BD770DRAFT_449406 [Pilaira anomala]